MRQAWIALARKDADSAERFGERLDAASPERPDGLQVRIQARLLRADVGGAIRLMEEEGLKRFGADAGISLTLAELKLSKGDARGAREILKRIPAGLEVGLRVRALSLEAMASEAEGQGAKAAAAMRTAVSLQPDNASLRYGYAVMLERVGRYDQAVQEAISLAASAPAFKSEAEKLRTRAEARKKELEEMERWRRLEQRAE